MRATFLLAAAAAIALASSGAVAGDTSEAREVIDRLDDATLRAVLGELGATSTPLDEDGTILRVAFADGGIAILRRTACDEGPCRGLLMTGLFELPEGNDAARADRLAREFESTANVAVIANDRGEHVLKAYVVLDEGITRANLAVNIALFAFNLASYRDALYAPQ